MRIYDAQVNHLTNPLGFYMERTVFSWKVAEAEGKRQTQARIVIALDENMKERVWDTGWDSEADSLGYEISLQKRACTRYFWKVMVCSDAGEEVQSSIQWFETAKEAQPWKGQWITCDSKETRHPVFEKEIVPGKQVVKARLYICGLGLYEAYYGGQRIGEEYLTPYSNDYNQWLQYQTFDVTESAKRRGTLSILLGNGWYKGRFGFTAREEKGFYGQDWKLIAELHLFYADNTEEIVATDESWQVRRSNILFSGLYDGEKRDDTLPQLPPEAVSLCEDIKTPLTARRSLPVKMQERFIPVELIHTPAGESVLDLGQEFAGIFALKVREPAGAEIHIQTGEVLQQGNFYNENLRTAKSEYIYISDGSPITLIPHFTYYGYRYVKITGISNLKKEDFTGIALYSDLQEKGRIETGHALVNQFLSNVSWGMKSNFLDVPTDCPQRDERMGWTGDAQIFAGTATYLADTYAFYAKYLYDMGKEQEALGGKVPDVVPSAGVTSTACVWGDAACIMPWILYVFYGDKAILREQYQSMKSWVEYVRKVDGADHGWRRVFHYGDWLALDNTAGGAQQTRGATDEEFIANVYYAASAKILAKAAEALALSEDAKEYDRLAKEQFAEVKREYYSATGRCCIKTQTALLLTLQHNLSDNRELILGQLKQLIKDSGNKLQTGFVGTPLLCSVLSENGCQNLAYQLLLNEEYPGWLHEVKLGATTVWERWNSILDDGSISGTSMNSLNHYSYGCVAEWMFRYCGGLNFTEKYPGCRKVRIAPWVNWELQSLKAEYDSPAGKYRCRWEILDESHVQLEVMVPFGCEAEIVFPKLGKMLSQADIPHILECGHYRFVYETTEPLKKKYSTQMPLSELLAHEGIRARLSAIMPLDKIPSRYHECSLRQIAAKFGERMGEEQLTGLDELLGAF